MERDSALYKARRKLQVFAHLILPDTFLAKLYSRITMGKRVDLVNPKTFNEKIQWCKINAFPNDELVVRCADKLRVRSYVEEKGLASLLVDLYGNWDDPNLIPWEELPGQFVLKCNHGCGYNILCPDKSQLDRRQTIQVLKKWLHEDFGAYNIELHYSEIKDHEIICEEFLGSSITDYKFFCFNGEPLYLYVSYDLIHDRQAKIGFFNLDGSPLGMTRDDYEELDLKEFPVFLPDMVRDARILSEDFPFVRVDYFVENNRYYFSELTFTPCAGMMPFNPDAFDFLWGSQLDIKSLRKTRDRGE